MAIRPESEESMKKGLTVIMAVICLALAAVYVVINLAEDDEPPQIEIQEQELVYTEGESRDVLLEGVTANDSRDGDVTDSLLVENVYPAPEAGVATVVYVARDGSNNIAKASRTVTYGAGDGTTAAPADSAAEETEVDSTPEPTAAPTATPEPTPTEEAEEDLPEGSPRITLTTDEDTVEAGTSVNRIEYVESIEDDEDDENALWRSIQITGDELDTDTPGTYELIYYVIDSDGNQSNEAPLTITVE